MACISVSYSLWKTVKSKKAGKLTDSVRGMRTMIWGPGPKRRKRHMMLRMEDSTRPDRAEGSERAAPTLNARILRILACGFIRDCSL